jgi:DNA-binding MarR family transcriptional regulator
VAQPPVARIDWVSDLIRLEIVLWERIDARLREFNGLPLSFFESLYFLSRAPEGTLRVGDLADALHVTVGGTSKLIDRLDAAGLIERRPDPDDRRASRVALTAQGKRKLKAAIKTYERAVAELIDPVLSVRDRDELHGHVARLLAALRKVEDG